MLINQLQNDLREAQLARDEIKVSTLRLLLSEIKNAQIALLQGSGQAPSTSSGQAKGENLSDQDIILVIQREVKKRQEAAEGFRKGEREEQALKEEAELKVLQSYLPEMLSNDQLTKIVEESITEVGANSLQDLGKVMGVVMSKVAARADGGTVSALVKERLS